VNLSSRKVVPILIVAAAALSWVAWRGPSAPVPQEAQASPLSVPEHKLLAKYAGTWDAELSVSEVPGQPASKSAGKAVARLTGGGLWLVTDFDATLMGAPFSGHEVLGYDASLKHYVITWVDSMGTSMTTGQLDFDAAAKSLGGDLHGRDPSGAEMNWRQTDVWKDDNTREWTMFMKGPDGNESAAIQITYKRHK
jgi:hypothetical protein